MTTLIDGKAIAQTYLARIKEEIASLVAQGKRVPYLVVILVGDDPASHVYVNHKAKACAQVGMKSHIYNLDKSSSEKEVLSLIQQLNADPEVDGILLQLPLPPQLDSFSLISALNPRKDVDGLTTHNQGLLVLNRAQLVPCTPLGIIALLDAIKFPLEGCRAVVIGRSSLVGAPVARLLEQRNATVTTVHSKTPTPQEISKTADLLVVAAGKHHLVDRSWVKPGAVVIDVGIHRVGTQLVGDVNFAEVAPISRAITPVPGGVGPMTIACLLGNCLRAYRG
jgi:methylenetetrahydrofolate dehydrogenase (NADP+)/methenyltetrahydrofolate cyclohydrolase